MPSPSKNDCPLCQSSAQFYVRIEDVDYFECENCDFIFASSTLLEKLDAGLPVRKYDSAYWGNELQAAKERSYGSSLARIAEAILYCRIPIKRFVDIGTGPGYLLDAVSAYLPSRTQQFHGVEKFPPETGLHTMHTNYHCSDLADVNEKFECGVCIEVLEHLTPRMAANLARAMSKVSVDGSLFLFNTGLTDYVRREDPAYLDPYGRGHVTCWSVNAVKRVFEAHGFQIHPLRGKSWAFVLEYSTASGIEGAVEDRIWSAPPENIQLLHDDSMGSVLYILGRESARVY